VISLVAYSQRPLEIRTVCTRSNYSVKLELVRTGNFPLFKSIVDASSDILHSGEWKLRGSIEVLSSLSR
jgi:hypothetical protein